jgi:hypothetical protein
MLEEEKESRGEGTMSGKERRGLGLRRRGQGTSVSGGRNSLSLMQAFLKERRNLQNSWNFRKRSVVTITTVMENALKPGI